MNGSVCSEAQNYLLAVNNTLRFKEVYWFHIVRPSVRPSIRLSVNGFVSAPLYLPQYLMDAFHIYTTYQATSEVVSSVKYLFYCILFNKIPKFDFFAVLVFLQLWLCRVWTWNEKGSMWIDGVGNHGAAGVFSERMRSSRSSFLSIFATSIIDLVASILH